MTEDRSSMPSNSCFRDSSVIWPATLELRDYLVHAAARIGIG
jgi:hypothetical protein